MLETADVVAFVATEDIVVARAFYEGTLGLRVVDESPFACVVDVNGTMLRITPVESLVAAPYTVLGWKVADAAATARDLAAAGIDFQRFDGMEQDELGIWTAPGGDKVAWFHDPDGNTLSITEFVAA